MKSRGRRTSVLSLGVACLWHLALLLTFIFITSTSVHAQADNSESTSTPLRIATKEIEPFVFVDDELSGFSIDLWRDLARTAGLDYEFVLVESVSEQIEAVTNGEADAGIAAISITQAREEEADFSYAYFNSGLGILVSTNNSVPFVRSLIGGSFNSEILRLVGALLFIVIIAGNVIWFLERGKNEDFPASYVKGVWQGIWWAAVTVTTVGYGDKTPRGPTGRVFALFWMIAGLFIIASFTAAVSSQFTLRSIQGAISGPQDLQGKILVTVEGSSADDWLTDSRIPHSTVDKIEEAYEMLQNDQVQAVVYDYPVLRYYALNLSDGKSRVVGGPFNREEYGIVFAEGSLLREDVNRALLLLREDGTYDTIYSRWFGH